MECAVSLIALIIDLSFWKVNSIFNYFFISFD